VIVQMTSTGSGPDLAEDPAATEDRAAVLELLGVLAYGELSAFDRMAADARMAPTVAQRAALSRLAAVEMGHYDRLVERISSMGEDPIAVMAPFVQTFEVFHARTEPRTWGEALVKAYVGDGLAADFYREVAQFVDASTRELVLDALQDAGNLAFAVREVSILIAADPTAASRLSLWGRRLVGEAISQTQRVAADRDALVRLIVGGTGGLGEIGQLIDRITSKHIKRMTSIGLSN
jgi:hypothetical protein